MPKNMIGMKKWLLSLIAVVAIQVAAQAPWQRAVVNYSRLSYHSGNQNWQIGQSPEGWMYFANNNGLLEFDGTNRTTYPLPGNTKVRSVLPAGDTIYVGALGQFGRFVRNAKGKMVYQDLSGHIGEKEQVNVWHIHRIGRDIYFQTDGTFFINDYKTKMAAHPGIRYSTVVFNKLYITSSKSVSVLVGKQFVPLRGIDIRKISNIVAILPWQQQLTLCD